MRGTGRVLSCSELEVAVSFLPCGRLRELDLAVVLPPGGLGSGGRVSLTASLLEEDRELQCSPDCNVPLSCVGGKRGRFSRFHSEDLRKLETLLPQKGSPWNV